MQDVFVQPSGQDDNLGDSALRVGLLHALRSDSSKLHVHLEGQSSDYLAGIPITSRDAFYDVRRDWIEAISRSRRPVFAVNAGEINPQPDRAYPHRHRAGEMRRVVDRGGLVIAAGIGLKDPSVAPRVSFHSTLREARVVSWRDHGSRDAAGFGEVAPDWAFALGTDPAHWRERDQRGTIAVTLRFDRPWPDDRWCDQVKALAAATGTRIVTVAQVARDAPTAVRLADALGGEYLVAASTRHDDLDRHVRSVYSRALAVVSDRAHGLIMGATEGAYPLGTAVDPQKITRLLDTADIGALTGHHDTFGERAAGLAAELPTLAVGVTQARTDVQTLARRIRSVLQID